MVSIKMGAIQMKLNLAIVTHANNSSNWKAGEE